MQYAVWIALAVVLIAILPSLLKRGASSSSRDQRDGPAPGRDGDAGDGDVR